MRQAGIPADILRKLARRKPRQFDINVLWCAIEDAIEFLESVIDGETPLPHNWRKRWPADARKIDRYQKSLKLYKRLRGQVIKSGNMKNWS